MNLPLTIGLGLLAFGTLLLAITFASAWAADVTGRFGMLFIQRPTRDAFRLTRYALALLGASAVMMAVD